MATVRTIKGELIDFDLLKIKQQIANAPKPMKVQEREQFVDRKLRRRVRKQQAVTQELDIDPSVDDTVEEVVDTVIVTEQPTTQPEQTPTTRKRRG